MEVFWGNVLLPSGYGEDFISPIDDDLLCLICQLALREPVLTRCGHRFYRQCLEQHLARQEFHHQVCNCPVDREKLERSQDVFPDKATERKILSFTIKCRNEGCEWIGELREKENHQQSCCFCLVPCANEKCNATIKRHEIEEHAVNTCEWRMVPCDHCSEQLPKCLMQKHVDDCAKVPLECANGCGENIIREMIETHNDNVCPLAIISCPYVDMGCSTKIPRKEVELHLQTTMRIHFENACRIFKEANSKLEEKIRALELDQTMLKQEKSTLKHQVQELKSANAVLEAKVTAQEENVSELMSGKFLWKITGFTDILKNVENGFDNEIYSSSFLTGKHGYKFSICLRPDGNRSNKHTYVSVFLRVMKGDFDAILPWPFRCNVTFTLLEQKDRINVSERFSNHPVYRPRSDAYFSAIGSSRFVSHKNLMTSRYLVKDTMFLQVEVCPCG